MQTIGVLHTAKVSKTSPTAAVSKTLTYRQTIVKLSVSITID